MKNYKTNHLSAKAFPTIHRGLAFGIIITIALVAFEIFNFSTTYFALSDLLGDLRFLGLSWATILAIAFCGIDFAGIARLFTPDSNHGEHNETWYLFGAWLLAATMNAMLTWWGVSLALLNQQSAGTAIIERDLLLRGVPIFVAILVWLIRVMMIGSFSLAGNQLFQMEMAQPKPEATASQRPFSQSATARYTSSAQSNSTQAARSQASARPSGQTNTRSQPNDDEETPYTRPEPSYQPLVASQNRSQTVYEPRTATTRTFTSSKRNS